MEHKGIKVIILTQFTLRLETLRENIVRGLEEKSYFHHLSTAAPKTAPTHSPPSSPSRRR